MILPLRAMRVASPPSRHAACRSLLKTIQGEYCLPPFTGNNHTLPTTMSVVGIDFGNQNAVIAAAGRGGVDVILNGNSNRLNP